ncbi:MAG: hypothetical protein WCF57_19415 [Pyrinomonadaceae bacterium]
MIEEDNATKDTQNADNSQDDSRPLGYLQGVFVAGAWAFIGLLLVALFWPNLSERTKFFTENLFNLIIAFAVIAQVVIYRKQWHVMLQQWQAMRDGLKHSNNVIDQMKAQLAAVHSQSEIMHRQFEITDRPWLSFEAIFTEPLTFTDQHVKLAFRFVAKNVGRSVAVNTTINVKLVIPMLGENRDAVAEVLREQWKVCQTVRSQFMAYAVFPSDTYEIQYGFALGRQDAERGRLANTKLMMMYLVGCVDYQFPGHDRHHQTRFAYEIMRINPANRSTSILEIGEDVPLNSLIMRKMFMGGDYAD